MSFRSFRRERKQQVKFAGDGEDSGLLRPQFSDGEAVAKSSREGPAGRFPNLQLMFKNVREHDPQAFDDRRREEEEEEEEMAGKSSGAAPVTASEEDIDAEANEYIKRKHHSLYLQKLMSMNATAA
ncbi:hypothetical protein AXF42_Ash018300 [Apostasia shenzhenica]|uniref:Uncharacterized protein n=1 Tax=Apostasia shenzhenica TaxID=1088818 RepID=A0A2I0B2Q9_9ASPA|nr:hypothetical protein AXF42_Ash018300 [Apostasia shenzhenica]